MIIEKAILEKLGFVEQKSDDESCTFYELPVESSWLNRPYISIDGELLYVFAKESSFAGSLNPIMILCDKASVKLINFLKHKLA